MATPMTPLSESSATETEVNILPSSDHETKNRCSTCIKSRRNRVILLCVLIAILAVAVGVLIGFFVPRLLKDSCVEISSAGEDVVDKFSEEVSTTHLEDRLRFFSSKPHVGGSERQQALANHIASKWREYGFDDVETPQYQVLLSEPQEDQPNTVEVLTKGTVEYTIVGKIKVNNKLVDSSSFQYFPFLAYAPSGDVEGELVYCNHGTEQDLLMLDQKYISVKGRIVLIRGYVGSVTAAARRGAVGALLYVDPKTVAREGYASQDTYPKTPWASKDAVFSKSLVADFGDPLTPDLPSIPGMYRRPRNESTLPSIPAQPISYGDALKLLSLLKGEEVPSHWRGDLKVTYRFGPGFTIAGSTVRLRVNNKLVVKSIYNVIGTITGQEEPDRYVLVGNHRDAEFFGAVDASSGSAVLMEMSRILGKLKEGGWRPRRTIKLCSWGAEEFGLIGSVEWVQENAKLLANRAVVYLNTDVAVGGNFLVVAQTCPMIEEAVFSRAKKVKTPSKATVYDNMVSRFSSEKQPGEPNTIAYAYASDYLPFYMSIGIPAADFSYFHGYKSSFMLYPVYHTQEDSFYWIKKFIDPKFEYHATMTRLIGGMLLDFSEAVILPLDVVRYAKALTTEFEHMATWLEKSNISTKYARNALQEFADATDLFQDAKVKLTGNENALSLRTINDQLVHVERAFITPYLKAGDPMYKHVFSRNLFMYSFPGVQIALGANNLDEVEKQLSLVEEAFLSAADIIRPVVCK